MPERSEPNGESESAEAEQSKERLYVLDYEEKNRKIGEERAEKSSELGKEYDNLVGNLQNEGDPEAAYDGLFEVGGKIAEQVRGTSAELHTLMEETKDNAEKQLSGEDAAILKHVLEEVSRVGINHPRIKNVLAQASNPEAQQVMRAALDATVVEQVKSKMERYGIQHPSVDITFRKLSEENQVLNFHIVEDEVALNEIEKAFNEAESWIQLRNLLEETLSIIPSERNTLHDLIDIRLLQKAKQLENEGNKADAKHYIELIMDANLREALQKSPTEEPKEDEEASESAKDEEKGESGESKEGEEGSAEDWRAEYEAYQEKLRTEQEEREREARERARQQEEEQRKRDEEAKRAQEQAEQEAREREQNKQSFEAKYQPTDEELERSEKLAEYWKNWFIDKRRLLLDENGNLPPNNKGEYDQIGRTLSFYFNKYSQQVKPEAQKDFALFVREIRAMKESAEQEGREFKGKMKDFADLHRRIEVLEGKKSESQKKDTKVSFTPEDQAQLTYLGIVQRVWIDFRDGKRLNLPNDFK